MNRPLHHRWVALLMCVALSVGLLVAGGPAPAHAAESLPGNRANYVFSFLATKPNATVLRMGTMSFQPNGTVSERVWEWDQSWAPVTRDVTKYRVNTGYTSAGCGSTACPIWTARGFNAAGAARTGTWKFTQGGTRVQINFGARYELYERTNVATFTQLTLISANYAGYSRFYGAAYGSKAALGRGATLDQIRAPGSPTQNGLNYRLVTANWGLPVADISTKQWWNSPNNYLRCGPTCVKGSVPTKWHSYMVADPNKLGRKMYWYHMLPSVARSTVCANPAYGGHTVQLLQILDDNGTFIGMLGGEASIMARYPGGSILSYYVGLRM